jgi:hypothetical protein
MGFALHIRSAIQLFAKAKDAISPSEQYEFV